MGTPAVIIPTFSERESNARRIAEVGAGEFILPADNSGWEKHVNTDDLRVKVRKVLTDPSYAISARQASEKLRAYGGATAAAYLIENFSRAQNDAQLLSNGQRPTPLTPGGASSQGKRQNIAARAFQALVVRYLRHAI